MSDFLFQVLLMLVVMKQSDFLTHECCPGTSLKTENLVVLDTSKFGRGVFIQDQLMFGMWAQEERLCTSASPS